MRRRLSERRKLRRSDLRRGWEVLPSGWKVALAAGLAWLLIVPTIATPLIVTGHRLPTTWRVLESLSKFVALVVVVAAVVKTSQLLGFVPSRGETALLIVFLLLLAYGFIGPVFP